MISGMDYWIGGTASGILIAGLIAVKVELAKRPTYKETDEMIENNKEFLKHPTFNESNEKYVDAKLCAKMHEAINDKMKPIPGMYKLIIQIATKMNINIPDEKL